MLIESNPSLLYSDTLVPDIFITEYLPNLSGEALKVYLYMLFLSKHNRETLPKDIAKKLEFQHDEVKEAFTLLESCGLIHRTEKSIALADIKEKEIKKLFRPKTTSSPEELVEHIEKNKRRSTTITAINEKFFQGLMSPSWYNDIDNWFERYKFDEDVMYTLFQHCADHNGLTRNYVEKVAQSWKNKNIKTSFDLDEYYMEYQKIKDIKNKIAKKLKLGRMLTEYEEDYVKTWNNTFQYDFEIIELVLKKTTGKTNPSFNYIHAILSDWHQKGLKTMDAILAHSKEKSAKTSQSKKTEEHNKTIVNFKQRDYAAEDLNIYYTNVNHPIEDDKGAK